MGETVVHPRDEELPPGTAYIEDRKSQHVLRCPVPTTDPNDPFNWTTRRKALHISILALYTLMIFASNSVSTPLWSAMRKDIDYPVFILYASFAANAAALAFGCILFVPFAIVFGRRPVYLATSLIVLACDIWSAETEGPSAIIAYNVLLGLAGSVNESLWQMTVTDMVFVHQRGSINAIYFVMIMTGNFLSPIPSGYISEAMGWRWSFGVTTIVLGVVTLLMIFFLEESKFDRINKDNAKGSMPKQGVDRIEDKGAKTTRAVSPSDAVEIDRTIPLRSYWQRMSIGGARSKISFRSFLPLFYRPFVVLWRFPFIFLVALPYGFFIAILGIQAVTQTTLYALPPYNFRTTGVAEMNSSPVIGAVLGAAFGGLLMDRSILFFAKRNKGIYEPEMRLWLVPLPAVTFTIGILVYGLNIAQGKPWIISAVGSSFIGFGFGAAGDMGVTYLQDTYQKIIGFVFIGTAFVINIVSVIFLAASTSWQANTGTYDMFVALGCISIFVCSLVAPVVFFGKRWRIRNAEKYLRMASLYAGSQ